MSAFCIVIVFARFGPYHLARLNAAGRVFSKLGARMIGIEIARRGGSYAWDPTECTGCVERVTLFPDNQYQMLSRREVARSLNVALNCIAPEVVAVPGWQCAEALAGLNWSRKNGRRSICMSDSKADDAPRHWWKEWVKTRIVRRFDAGLVAGAPHRDYIRALGMSADRIATGYDVVDNEYFERECQGIREATNDWRESLDLRVPFFLVVARFIAVKNLDRLLAAYAQYRSLTPSSPWHLVIAGDGELRADLHARAHHLELDGLHWPGFLQYSELPKYYGTASALIFPSVKDTWGLTVNEAMAAGLPVLVSRLAGCRYDLVDDGENGFLFNPYHIDDMASAMIRMSALPAAIRETMGRRSREIISEWGPDRFADGLLQAVRVSTGTA